MCGRFVLTPKLQKIIAQFGVTAVNFDDVLPCYNVAPSKLVPVVTYAEKIQQRQIELMNSQSPWPDLSIARRARNS